MSNVKPDPHDEELLQQYRQLLPTLEKLSDDAYDLLSHTLRDQGIYVTAIERRIKTEKSLARKLALKGTKYKRIDDITDLVGLRVITVYTDEVDKVAVIVKNIFDIDWQESVDKRKLHDLNSFGYNSLHYNDTGYKGDVKIPREYLRQFNRLAGMMELLDDEFSRLRFVLTDYRRHTLALVKSGHLDDVPLSPDSLHNYLDLKPFDRLNRRIASVNQAEIVPVSVMPYLPVLESFGLETLGDMQRFIDENSDDAYQLALAQLAITDLDILSSNTALQYLCMVYVLKHDGGREGLKSLYDIINGESDANGMLTDMIIKQAETLPFMQGRKS